MEFLSRINNSNSAGELHNVIVAHQQEMFDYFSLINYAELSQHKDSFKQLLLKYHIVSELNYSESTSEAFVNLILNTAIRLGDMAVFEKYYSILRSKNLEVSSLIEASSFFMMNVKSISDLQSNYNNIVTTLEDAYENESDNNKDSISATINYYAICVKHFAEFATNEVEVVRDKLLESYRDSSLSYLTDEVITQVCSVSLDWNNNPYERIHQILDTFLGRVERMSDLQREEFLIESEGAYHDAIINTERTFADILQVNQSFYEPIKDSAVFHSLSRGVKVLEDERQLYCYVYAYGKMHRAKLVSAIKALPEITSNHQVVDWGCGQGIGSLLYLEYLESKGSQGLCKEVTLIEPSEQAISRASLHIQNRTQRIKTINKGFDHLVQGDLTNTDTTVHIFSNILDVELFSLLNLISLIDKVFKGVNYLIVSSPYINTSRTARIDSFMQYFQKKYDYVEYLSVEQSKSNWINNWSRVIRVGKIINDA